MKIKLKFDKTEPLLEGKIYLDDDLIVMMRGTGRVHVLENLYWRLQSQKEILKQQYGDEIIEEISDLLLTKLYDLGFDLHTFL